MEDILVPVGIVGMLFIGLPWLILHYSTKWKQSGAINREDEDLLDELYDLARRLDSRMESIERIIAADNPDWRPHAQLPEEPTLDEQILEERSDKIRRL